ncbi:MAG: methylmalonyl Co-A mutase-associated GTPase MeaB [Acidimicrobiales bacterium]
MTPAPPEGEDLGPLKRGDRRVLARVLSVVERGGEASREVADLVQASGTDPRSVGITGAPGAGKSTLTNALLSELRESDEIVAVLAVDPTSPITGGAILGDRVRMQSHATDSGVFIRSMASRGHLGGLSLATPEAVRVLGYAGWPTVFIETVGVGQIEVDIAGAADTTVVVVNPGWGDSVQANKAGLLEVADIFVINKADRVGADEAERDLVMMLELGAHKAWTPPILKTVATTGAGVTELAAALTEHWDWMHETGELERRRVRRATSELREILLRHLGLKVDSVLSDRAVKQRLSGASASLYALADELLASNSWGSGE